MVCYLTCASALAFIVASIYVCVSSKSLSQPFEKTLDQDQQIIYQKIVKQRMQIYIIATIVGAILGLLYLILLRNKQSTWALICTAVVIFFGAQIIIYLLYPKSDYMLNHINDQEQAKAWMALYNEMMKKYLIGFVLGLIGYGLLCLAFLR